MSIYKVERKVDTVIIEMDISMAEKLREVLELAVDRTRESQHLPAWSLSNLRALLDSNAEVRSPSPLYRAEGHEGYVLLRNITETEREAMR